MAYFDQTIYLIGILERATKKYLAIDANNVRPSLSDARWATLAILVSSVLLLPLAIRFISLHPPATRPNRRRHLAQKNADRSKVLSRKIGTDDGQTGDENTSEFESSFHHVVRLQKEEVPMNEVAVSGEGDHWTPPALKGGKPNDIIGLAPMGVVYDSGCCRLADSTPDNTSWGVEYPSGSQSAIANLLLRSLNVFGSALLDGTRTRALDDPVPMRRRHLATSGDGRRAPPPLNGGSPEQCREERDSHPQETMAMSIIMTAAMWQMHFAQWACLSGTSQLFNERAYRRALSSGKWKSTSDSNK